MNSLLDPLFNFFATVLSWIYSIVPSYGFTIIIFTVIMMAVFTPLTVKSTKSMLQMQRLQPELKALQAKYKGDREQLNAAMMAYYKENDISPLGGCLPILAQSPVFIVMYRLMSGLTTRVGGVGSGVGHIVTQVANGKTPTSWVYDDQNFLPEHISTSSKLYKSLIGHSEMKFFGLDLSVSPKNALTQGIVTFLPFAALLVAILVIQVYQNRQIQARNTSAQANPQQQMLLKVMPFMLPIFAFSLSAAMALYWGIQGLCRIVTQAYITKKFYKDHEGEPATQQSGNPKSGGQRSGTKSESKVPASTAGKAKGSTSKGNNSPKSVSNVSSSASPRGKQARGKSAGRKSLTPSAKRSSDTSSPTTRRSGDPRASGR